MIDFKNPDYTSIIQDRQLKLADLENKPLLINAMKIHYRDNPWEFITEWGWTFDPRKVEEGKLANIPFVLWPRQVEYLKWLMVQWKAGERGLVEKSRDCGVTWLSVGFCVTQWLFSPGFSAGFGSRKEDLVDKLGDPDSIFEKIRHFLSRVPPFFMPQGFNERLHSGYMKLINPENGASITGEAGNNIGRGGRKSLFLVDEAAFIEQQLKVDNALSNTTNCQIDISTYNGNGNVFYRKSMKFDGTRRKFVFDWKADPRKDDAWYAKQVEEKDPVTVAQEIDRDPNASAENTFIPAKWVQAAIDIHDRIHVHPTGIKVTAFDPADVGDARATVSRYGYVIDQAEIMQDGDITNAIPWAYEKADEHRSEVLIYDADGMGAPVMKLTMTAHAQARMRVESFYGSGEVQDKNKRYGEDPENPDPTLKTNGDAFVNFRAQAWTWVRDRFEKTYKIRQHIDQGGVVMKFDPDEIISIDSKCKNYFELVAELSRPERKYTNNGKIRVESKAEMKSRGVESPNLADSAVMCMSVSIPKSRAAPQVKVRKHRISDRMIGL